MASKKQVLPPSTAAVAVVTDAQPRELTKKDAPMAVASRPTWKPQQPAAAAAERSKATESAKSSAQRWVLGEIDTKQHNENLKKAKKVLGWKT